MAINFPDPSASPWYNDPASGGNGVTYVYTSGGYWTAVQVTGSNAIDQTTGDARYVNVSGDSMTGHLNVAGTVSVGTTASAAVLQFPAATGWGPRIQQGGASINDFGVFTNNTEALTVKSNGNVGIGTTSPGTNLEIKATSVPVIRLNQADTYYAPIKLAGNDLEIRGSSGTIEFYNGANDGDSSTEKMCIDSSGNVGIGTSSPSDILHLNSSTGYGLKITDASSHIATYRTHGDGAILKTASNHALLFGTNDTERMRIDSSGNVGIGKSSNLFYRLTFQEGSGDASRIGWVSTSGNRKASIDCGNTAAIVFNTGTGDDERMRIDSSGFVLIGTTVSSSLSDRLLTVGQGSRAASYLEIRSSSTGDGGLLFSDGTSGNAGYRGQVVYSHSIDALQFWTAATERMRINSSGEFRHTPGGATSSTYMKSNVENTNEYVFKVFRDGAHSTAITFQTQISGAGAERMRIDSSGRLLVGTSSMPTNSDSAAKIGLNGSIVTKAGSATINNTFTSITGATVGNETSVYLVSIKAIGDGNFYSSATYILNSAAYSKTFTQLGTASSHFGNGTISAQLSSYSTTSASIQVKRSNSGLATCWVHMLKLL